MILAFDDSSEYPQLRLAAAVDHPQHAEFVGEGAEVGAPEHVLQGHADFAAFG